MKRHERIRVLLQRLTADSRFKLTADEELLLREAEQQTRRLDEAGNDFKVQTLVSHKTGEGKLDVVWMSSLAQVAPVNAREIAWILLEAAAVAEAEAMLMRFLKDKVGLAPEKAAVMLNDFRGYREAEKGSLVGTERPA